VVTSPGKPIGAELHSAGGPARLVETAVCGMCRNPNRFDIAVRVAPLNGDGEALSRFLSTETAAWQKHTSKFTAGGLPWPYAVRFLRAEAA